MATPKELLDRGDLRGAIEAQTQEVKANPVDPASRTLLFELLCFAGEWDRAEKQIDVVGGQSTQSGMAVLVYKAILHAAREREKLFAAGTAPHFLIDPPGYIDLHLEAVNRIREGKHADARELLDRAEAERPPRPGKLNGRPFEDFRDYDDVLAPVLELVVKDKYVWLPYDQVRAIHISEPKKLRDLMFTPVKIEATDGTIGEVFLFALYPGSEKHADDAVKLGRMTDWKTLSEDLQTAVGLRTFLADDEDKGVFEVRQLEFETVPVAVAAPETPAGPAEG